ncbi:hypothetical protein COM04_08550 [Bacillus wiedmannii]|uniref:hypothetical protein n=1 Tax=Bacillus wiedmannii TaxID=1890302 RepID=UPI000BF50013|nr:hypothetical protein [Bacillus wiedmannii]PEP76943.1 hypothetical protein CN573_05285 [Bacillus wiedmannii]PGB98137.1 hypothetical protein COM04_08550 [Bacillus wiedmannii]PHE04700.1 hypothetical protein COF56_11455 [Bacillus wiedmannii]
MTCFYNGVSYSEGSTICMNGTYHICENGRWEPAGLGTCDSTNSVDCFGVGIPPGPTPPINPQTPSVQDMVNCISHWTYFWTKRGQFWMYVKSVSPDPTNTYYVVNGCYFTGSYDPTTNLPVYQTLSIPINEIYNYFSN